MLDAEEVVELRALQARAYGRGGALDAGDAERLRQLQERHDRGAAAEAAAGSTPSAGHETLAAERLRIGGALSSADDSHTGQGAATTGSDAPKAAEAHASVRGALRSYWRPVLVAAVVLLFLGIGTGWALFAPRAAGIALTEQQLERQRELIDEGDFDPGSVRAVGQDDDALVWYATRGDGDLACIVIAVEEDSSTECIPRVDSPGFAMSASVSLPPKPNGEARDYSSVVAFLMFSTSGEPMVAINRWTETNALIGQFVGAQRERAAEIIDAIDPVSLSVIGSFLDQPVWMADRFTDEGEIVTCLIVDAPGGGSECLPSIEAQEDGIAVHVTEEAHGDAPAAVWILTLAYTEAQTPYLTIVGNAEVTTVEGGSSAAVGGENGDPIHIGIPEDSDD